MRATSIAAQQAGALWKISFPTQNLVALREIALRRCADRINKLAEKVKTSQSGDYYTDEHILVCLSSSPSNAKIIRTGARMASAFKGSFTALFVETSTFPSMSEENRSRLRKNIHLAQQLGATIETVYGDDIALQIAEFARLSGVSKIVMGRSNIRRRFLWSKPSLTEQLIRFCPQFGYLHHPGKKPAALSPGKTQKQVHCFFAARCATGFGNIGAVDSCRLFV